MNKVILMGRLTREPEIRHAQDTTVARYTLAVDRTYKREGEQNADFISCVTFGKGAEFVEKYLHQGIKIVVAGRIKTGSYTNRDGVKIYTTDVVVEEQEFAESKSSGNKDGERQDRADESVQGSRRGDYSESSNDGFMNIPDNIDEELPFS